MRLPLIGRYLDARRWTFAELADAVLPTDPEPHVEDTPLAQLQAECHVVDLRGKPKRGRSARRGWRSWAGITGVVLHQTAVAGMGATRFLGVPVHGAVDESGNAVLLWDPPALLWHAHSANRPSIGIEISCRAAGTEGDERTVWLSKRDKAAGRTASDVVTEATGAQLRTARALVEYYDRLTSLNGGVLKYLWAHRHSHKSRTSDPGSRIWRGVAVPLMAELGLREGPVLGSGHTLPESWKTQ